LNRSFLSSPVVLWAIGAYKLAKALLALVAGVLVLRLSPDDAIASLVRVAARLRLDPDDRLIHAAVARLSGIDARHLEAIGAGIVLYGLLYAIEGLGLLWERRWAEYLVVITTGYLIPFEVYEVVKKAGAVRVAVLSLNLLIVGYLIVRLRREGRCPKGPPGDPPPSAVRLDA
jgi:uncharacterized membrane protein (DUF2068 family)